MNYLKNILVICFFVGVFNSLTAARKICKTPNSGVNGSCKKLEFCDPLKKTLQRRFGLSKNYDWQKGQRSPEMRTFLEKYSILCGRNKFCCGDPLPFSECGDASTDKISAGTKTKLEEFNWMALLQYKNWRNEITSECGGSLISNKYVLTAAHCIKPFRITLHSVVLGEYKIGVDPDCKNMPRNKTYCTSNIQTFLVDSTVVHPDYNETTKENDIALVRLKGDADISQPNVKTICIAPPNTEPGEEDLTVTGWGKTEFQTGNSDVLLKASVGVASQRQCEAVFAKTRAVITNKQFCGGIRTVGQTSVATCQGDSGGPVFKVGMIPQYRNDPKFIQQGIVSFSKNDLCGSNKANSVYTKVSAYHNWILDNMQP